MGLRDVRLPTLDSYKRYSCQVHLSAPLAGELEDEGKQEKDIRQKTQPSAIVINQITLRAFAFFPCLFSCLSWDEMNIVFVFFEDLLLMRDLGNA